MIDWQHGLLVPLAGLYLDDRQPRKLCFVSHAHSDHLGQHQLTIATPQTTRLARRRGYAAEALEIPFFETRTIAKSFQARLLHAGHILGSAMLHLQGPDESLLYTGDFKLRPSRTVETAQPVPADWLLMESTYGLPHFRFPPRATVETELLERCHAAIAAGKQPVVMGYPLGKSQEIIAILHSGGLAVTAHGSIHSICQVYSEMGVELGPIRRYAAEDFHGRKQLDLAQRGVLVAPPSAARTPFCNRFTNPILIMMTGWALQKGAQFRYGVDAALPLSDHADFDELLELIEIVRPKKILTHHGYPQFVDHLRMRGFDARLAKPDPQLELFP